jgi:thioredoxin reductase
MEKGVRIGDKQDEKSLLETDTVVLATGMKPTTGFWEILRGKIPEIYFIGDCVEPRKVMMAIWEGFRTARLI